MKLHFLSYCTFILYFLLSTVLYLYVHSLTTMNKFNISTLEAKLNPFSLFILLTFQQFHSEIKIDYSILTDEM